MLPIATLNSKSRGATSRCSRASSNIADSRPIVTTTNVWYCGDHTGTATFRVDYLSLAPGVPTSVLGHAIMVHEKADDMKTDPTGNAGNRIACGVINAPTP